MKFKNKDITLKDRQRRNKIAKHNINAAEICKHYIDWKHEHLECKDCGGKVTEGDLKLMMTEKCGWHHGIPFNYMRIKETKERRRMELRWSRKSHCTKTCTTIQGSAAFTWLLAMDQETKAA